MSETGDQSNGSRALLFLLASYGVLLLSIAGLVFELTRVRADYAKAEETAKRAEASRKDIVRLTAGGWKFEKSPPPDPVYELEHRIKYLEDIYESSVQSRAQMVRDKSLSLRRWDQQIQDLATKLVRHREELARLRERKEAKK